ncbi:Histidine triad nucleotide-binding protein [Fructilactobacillus florum 8D]|uniref:Histidine triad nucleotide-binding protein n=1 Tax=Fructilactobacillus florum 8D TaxID=1221538 RepID=W9EDH4_9LACO|nr:HIT family protein [Fructilactobacillus florum]EKK20662.1 Histidine triad nucleotide-binding protein [Fructilactobacillus florum 2F]ETO40127.1 Histidine triad nucleotide-binding protein [Fructilactobacillus florum 8D]
MSNLHSDCVFCKIIAGDIPSYPVFEDDVVLAFLDISQATPGHTLVIPKQHLQDIYAMSSEQAGAIFSRIPQIARAIRASDPQIKGMNIVNDNGVVAYQSVFHAHFHLIPRYQPTDDFNIHFGDHSTDYQPQQYQALQTAIKKQLH